MRPPSKAPAAGRWFLTTFPIWTLSLMLAVFAASCKKGESPSEAFSYKATVQMDKGAPSPSAGEQRKLILTYGISIETPELEKAFREVNRLAEEAGGYVTESSRQQLNDGSYHGRLAFRLPPKGVGSFLDRVRALGKVLSENSTGRDITEEYADLDARLRNAKVSEERLLGFMAKRTEKIADVIELEREISRVRGEIESMEARKRTWDLLTQTVAVTVEISEPPHAAPAVRKVWFPIKTAFGEGLVLFSHSLSVAITLLGVVLPWLVLVGVPLYIIVRLLRRRKKLPPAA